MWFVYASFYSSDQLRLRNRSIVWWLGRRFCASSEMVAHQSPIYLIFWCAMALVSLDLFRNSKLYEWLNELAAVLICNLILFLYGCPSAKLLSTSAEICSPSASSGTTCTLSVDFAASFFFDDLFCARDCSQLSRFYCLLFCVTPRGFPRVSVVVSTLFLGRQLLLLKFFFSEHFWSVFEVDDLCEELGRNCVVAQDSPVRCLIESQRILRCLQIHHKQSSMMVLHVEVRLVLRVGVRIQWRNDWEVHCFSAFAYSKSSWHKSTKFYWIFMSWESNMIQQWCISFLDLVGWKRWHVHILAWVTLQSSDVHRFFPLKMGMTLAVVTADLSSLLLLSSKLQIFLSFFDWWAFQETDTVSVHVLGSGSLFGGDPMCSLQGRCSCSVTFSNVPRQRCSLFGNTWLRLFWKISWDWNNRATSSLNRRLLMLKVSLGCQCDILCCWVFLSLWTSHCFDFLSERPYLLLQSDDNFELLPCTRWTKSISQGWWCLALSHQCPRFLLCWKYSFSLIGPILLLGLILRSNCPPSTLVGLSTSPQGMLSNPALFRASLVWMKELPDLQDFCVICTLTESIKFFVCLFVHSFDNWHSCWLIRLSQEVSLCRRSFAVCMPSILQKVMPLLRGFPPLSEHSLRHFQLQKAKVEAEWRSPRLGVRNNRSRIEFRRLSTSISSNFPR